MGGQVKSAERKLMLPLVLNRIIDIEIARTEVHRDSFYPVNKNKVIIVITGSLYSVVKRQRHDGNW